jgi:predicted GNAT superfamily acetyltransferase
MLVRVQKVTSLAECDTARAIAAAVWGLDAACSTPQMSVHANYGGVVLLAYVDVEPVGFLFSFPALYRGEWVLWSHETAVLSDYLHQGIGTTLKLAQRDAARELGYRKIAWTYDPLVSRNAHFNLNKLGARVVEYKVNAYGADEGDLVNRGIETDRFIAVWDVPKVDDVNREGDHKGDREDHSDLSAGAVEVEQHVTNRDGAENAVGESEVVLAFCENGQPTLNLNHRDGNPGKFGNVAVGLTTQIPLQDPETHQLRVSWRHAFREAALDLFGQGFVPVSFRRTQAGYAEYVWHRSNDGQPFERRA